MQAHRALGLAATFALLCSCQKQPSRTAQTSEPAAAPATPMPTKPKPAKPAPSKPPIKPHASVVVDKLGTLPDGVGLAVGSRVPDIEVKTHLGDPRRLAKLVETGPLLLIFYRGGW